MALRTRPLMPDHAVYDALRELPRLQGKSRPSTRLSPETAVAGAEDRRVLQTQQDDDEGRSARLEEIHVDGRGYFEVIAKVPNRAEVTHTSSHRPNADLVYEIAGHGAIDLDTGLLDLPRAFWRGKRELADRVLTVPGFTDGPDPGCPVCKVQP